MAVSIRDVARAASLSCETILEVLVSPSSLEPEVVRFVMKTIRKTGYFETFARWKTGKSHDSIAVLTTTVDSPSDIEMFRGIDRVISALGLTVSMFFVPTRFSPTFREESLSTLLMLNMVTSVITLNLNPKPETVKRYSDVGKPLVMLQTKVNGGQSVLLENQKGMSIAVNYLCNKGCNRIALMNGPSSGGEPGSVPSERLLGYVSAMQRVGLPFDESLVYETQNYDGNSGIHGFEYFNKSGQLPDAVICASGDMTAIGFIKEAAHNGVRVPDDILVVGYDDIPVAALVTPALTTIRQRLMIAGAGAVILALEAVVNGPGEDLLIVPELVVRGTA